MQLPRVRRRRIQQFSIPEGLLAYARLGDPVLVKRAKGGDARALEALCERHAPRVRKLAGHVLRDPGDARDAAQEALAKLCSKIRQFRGVSQFATWLHRLTINDRAEFRGELNRYLAEIGPDQARVVVLKDALGFSFAEISAAADMPIGTAKCHAHRGRSRLRAKLSGVA
jgi:DNA-directed RNA polymerase specialized sigma24 family protein